MSKWTIFYEKEVKEIKQTLAEFENWYAGSERFDLPDAVQDILRSGKVHLEGRLELYKNQISRANKGEPLT